MNVCEERLRTYNRFFLNKREGVCSAWQVTEIRSPSCACFFRCKELGERGMSSETALENNSNEK